MTTLNHDTNTINPRHAEIVANLVRNLLSGNFPKEINDYLLTLEATKAPLTKNRTFMMSKLNIGKYSKEQLDAFERALTHQLQNCSYNNDQTQQDSDDKTQQYSFVYCESFEPNSYAVNPIAEIIKNSLDHAGIAINDFVFPFRMFMWINQKEISLAIIIHRSAMSYRCVIPL